MIKKANRIIFVEAGNAISILMKPNPNSRMHRALILRAGDFSRQEHKMKASITEDIRQLLPELFGPAGPNKRRSDGMCTPESGCAPAREESATDIVRLLSENGSAGKVAADKEKSISENHDPAIKP
jgi:hypothetical protein